MAICLKQLWNVRFDHLSLFKVVCNDKEWFVDYSLFLIVLIITIEKENSYYKALVSLKMKSERVKNSNVSDNKKLLLLSILGD